MPGRSAATKVIARVRKYLQISATPGLIFSRQSNIGVRYKSTWTVQQKLKCNKKNVACGETWSVSLQVFASALPLHNLLLGMGDQTYSAKWNCSRGSNRSGENHLTLASVYADYIYMHHQIKRGMCVSWACKRHTTFSLDCCLGKCILWSC